MLRKYIKEEEKSTQNWGEREKKRQTIVEGGKKERKKGRKDADVTFVEKQKRKKKKKKQKLWLQVKYIFWCLVVKFSNSKLLKNYRNMWRG